MPATAPRETERRSARREEILDAAVVVFAHYGYRRASLDEIARESGSSRTALYHYFRNKDGIFRAMIEALQERTLARARGAAERDTTPAERLVGALEARLGSFHELVWQSRHRRELLDAAARQSGPALAAGLAVFQKLLVGILRRAERDGVIDLRGRSLRAETAAALLVRCAEGLKAGDPPPSPQEFREGLATVVGIFLRGLAP
jgi:AcrR family transcriptional regulator